jgi:hypothetical protein
VLVLLVVGITSLLSMLPIAFFAVMTKCTSLVWLFFNIAQEVTVFVDLVKPITHFWMLFHTIFKVYVVAMAEIKGGLVRCSSTSDVRVLSKMQAVLEYYSNSQSV